LGVNPQTGTAPIDRAKISGQLARYADEFNSALSPTARGEAKARRIAEDRALDLAEKNAAVEKLLLEKVVPEGFSVIQHRQPEGRHEALSTGVNFGTGFVLVRTADVVVAESFGYRVAPYPDSLPPDEEAKIPPGSLPPVPLAVVRHKDPTVRTDRGVALGSGGCRLVRVEKDLKYLVSQGWQPTPYPPAP
jgi:hypothetical protein